MLANATLLAANNQLTDDIVISNILRGQTEEYEILVRRYNSMLYKVAHGLLSDEGDIEDVMQEAYIKGFEKLAQFRNEAKFSTWLTRILINCALQQVHKLKGKEYIDIDTLNHEELVTFADTPPDSHPDISDNLKKAVEGAIHHLPSKYRIIFILREVEHMTVLEAARMLDISEENVKIRLHRAKSMLRDILRSQLISLEVFEFHATRCTAMAFRVMSILVEI